ncbi:MAG: (4Fe-4S)-binding protein [Gemmatimonadaceae bacterium]|nr:(4Fe-4S)-binding protein [Chitinophagaceae bacterium]
MRDTFKYSNDDITVIWQPAKCIHSKKCWQNLGLVFDPRRKPWVVMANADTDSIIRQVDQCPSQALSYERIKTSLAPEQSEAAKEAPAPTETPGANTEKADVSNIIECVPNGPLLISGQVVIKKSDGSEVQQKGTIALCRCGASRNKPYCDGSHNAAGFVG